MPDALPVEWTCLLRRFDHGGGAGRVAVEAGQRGLRYGSRQVAVYVTL